MAQDDDTDIKHEPNFLVTGSTNSAVIEAYYDEWAETYDATLKDWDYQAPAEAAATLSSYLKPGANILDVGCGTGMFSKAMSVGLECRIEGIDISASSLAIAKKHGIYDGLRQHDLQITPLPFDSDAFDAAACVGVLTYIEDATDLLVDLCRVVQPGGYVLFTQRDDRWVEKGFAAVIDRLQALQLWKIISISEAKPYLPKNDQFGNGIRVIQVLCNVLPVYSLDQKKN